MNERTHSEVSLEDRGWLQQIAEAAAAVKRLADHFDDQGVRERHQSGPGFDEGQLRVELEFRAMRNALGNFGRRGQSDVALLRSPHLLDGRLLLERSSLPKETDSILVFYRTQESRRFNLRDGHHRGDRDDEQPDFEYFRPESEEGRVEYLVLNVGDCDVVTGVQVDDAYGNPLRLGLPHRED
ncbi:hypothetical protein [Streptomyces sp. NPDC041003]|uniref:hypothetical protein n=1 Tax=Streptomyces sp. NPDC041003 TaxID=3155730 RepID=UPI0033D3534A